MCGIVGYIEEKESFPLLMKALHRLEYRGYDSSGVALCNERNQVLRKLANDFFEITECHPAVGALFAIVPLQLFAYYISVLRGCNVDQPRNMAKYVTVE